MADLQQLVDELASSLGRPASVDDPRFRPLAHSADTGESGAERHPSIPGRSTSDDVAAWLERRGLLLARGPVEVPEHEPLGVSARWAVPLRHADALLGFLWVVVGDRPLTDAEHERLERAARQTRDVLWQRRVEVEEDRRGRQALLASGLSGAEIAGELAAALGWPENARCAVALAEGDEGAAERARGRWPSGSLVWLERAPGIVVVARLEADAGAASLGAALGEAGVAIAGVSGAAAGLRELSGAREQAETALLCARAGAGSLGAAAGIAAWDELGSWTLVARLWRGAGRPSAPAAVAALLAHKQGAELLHAAEAVLDAGGDVAAAAAEVQVHRATLYRRLERVEEVTGLDLARGDDRLLLHLGIRIWRLSGE
jgi:hypothetical protein